MIFFLIMNHGKMKKKNDPLK